MAINFLDPVFYCTVNSSCPSVDGHPVSNLLSSDDTEQNRGFLPETFMRPPVNIQLTFPCQVDLHRVIFSAVVGGQKTSGVELYSHTTNISDYCQDKLKLQNQAFIAETGTSAEKVFVKIGYGNLQEQNIACFSSRRFNARQPFRHLDPMKSRHSDMNADVDTATFSMCHRNHSNISSVHSITLRLVRPAHGKLCAIKWLEVWGQPAYSCSKETVQGILDRYSMSAQRQVKRLQCLGQNIGETSVQPAGERRTESASSTNKSKSTVSIPEEFLDPVTLEVMSMPMLVPSGQTLDQQTLDKHYAQEAKWGRLPNNPFTGVPFTSNSRPVPNTGLKLRIDQFLLRHGADLPDMGRMLGSAQGVQAAKSKISSLLSTSAARKCHAQQETVSLKTPASTSASASHTVRKPAASTSASASHTVKTPAASSSALASAVPDWMGGTVNINKTVSKRKSSALCNMPEKTDTRSGPSVKRSAGTESACATKSCSLPSMCNLEAPTSPNIDEVLSSTLQSLPSYLDQRQTELKDMENKVQCSVCCRADASCYYQLECMHVVCRDCLTGQSEGDLGAQISPGGAAMTSCVRCGTLVSRQGIIRLHVCLNV